MKTLYKAIVVKNVKGNSGLLNLKRGNYSKINFYSTIIVKEINLHRSSKKIKLH